MTRPPLDELLSAYADGELADEDRAYIERELNSQPELRKRLKIFRKVSQQVSGLPATPAPMHLADSIMAGIESASD